MKKAQSNKKGTKKVAKLVTMLDYASAVNMFSDDINKVADKKLDSGSDPEPMHTVKEWQAMGKCPSDSQIQASHARKEVEALLSVSSVAIDQPSFGVQTMIQTLLVDEIRGQVESRIDLVKAINKLLSLLDAEKKESDARFLSYKAGVLSSHIFDGKN